jgi:hypothetical protein
LNDDRRETDKQVQRGHEKITLMPLSPRSCACRRTRALSSTQRSELWRRRGGDEEERREEVGYAAETILGRRCMSEPISLPGKSGPSHFRRGPRKNTPTLLFSLNLLTIVTNIFGNMTKWIQCAQIAPPQLRFSLYSFNLMLSTFSSLVFRVLFRGLTSEASEV